MPCSKGVSTRITDRWWTPRLFVCSRRPTLAPAQSSVNRFVCLLGILFLIVWRVRSVFSRRIIEGRVFVVDAVSKAQGENGANLQDSSGALGHAVITTATMYAYLTKRLLPREAVLVGRPASGVGALRVHRPKSSRRGGSSFAPGWATGSNFENRIEELARLLRVTVGQELHRALEVGEEDSDLLALALEGGL
jgi:hypothetical protein